MLVSHIWVGAPCIVVWGFWCVGSTGSCICSRWRLWCCLLCQLWIHIHILRSVTTSKVVGAWFCPIYLAGALNEFYKLVQVTTKYNCTWVHRGLLVLGLCCAGVVPLCCRCLYSTITVFILRNQTTESQRWKIMNHEMFVIFQTCNFPRNSNCQAPKRIWFLVLPRLVIAINASLNTILDAPFHAWFRNDYKNQIYSQCYRVFIFPIHSYLLTA